MKLIKVRCNDGIEELNMWHDANKATEFQKQMGGRSNYPLKLIFMDGHKVIFGWSKSSGFPPGGPSEDTFIQKYKSRKFED